MPEPFGVGPDLEVAVAASQLTFFDRFVAQLDN